MGYYIPNGVSLEEQGAEEINQIRFDEIPNNKALICQVNNGAFKANALCYSQEEYDVFTGNKADTRPRKWFLMEKEQAHKLSNYK